MLAVAVQGTAQAAVAAVALAAAVAVTGWMAFPPREMAAVLAAAVVVFSQVLEGLTEATPLMVALAVLLAVAFQAVATMLVLVAAAVGVRLAATSQAAKGQSLEVQVARLSTKTTALSP